MRTRLLLGYRKLYISETSANPWSHEMTIGDVSEIHNRTKLVKLLLLRHKSFFCSDKITYMANSGPPEDRCDILLLLFNKRGIASSLQYCHFNIVLMVIKNLITVIKPNMLLHYKYTTGNSKPIYSNFNSTIRATHNLDNLSLCPNCYYSYVDEKYRKILSCCDKNFYYCNSFCILCGITTNTISNITTYQIMLGALAGVQ